MEMLSVRVHMKGRLLAIKSPDTLANYFVCVFFTAREFPGLTQVGKMRA